MKSFSQFITEKKKEEFIINSKGEKVPISQATRQDVGMAPKDLENVTPVDDVKTNKVNKISKKTSGSRKVVFRATPGEIKLEREIVKQQTPGTNVSVNPSGLSVRNRPGTITTNV